jgi:hypothetical protein
MVSGRELALGIIGAWRLARADRTGLLCFDRTPRGFWRSFWVVLILAPAQAVLVAINLAELKIEPASGHVWLLETGFYILDALLLPAVLSELALRRGRIPQVVAFTVAYNYAQILIIGLWFAAIGLGSMLPQEAAFVVQLLTLGVLLFYEYRIARIAFDLAPLPATGVVVLSLALSLALQSINTGLLQAYIPAGA